MQPRLLPRHLTTGRTQPRSRSDQANVLPSKESQNMLWTITIILFILWILGLVSSYTLGGWIHILLVLAIIVLIFNLLSGRRAL
jgi:hypothetical protein